jgi:hypothetical protein
MQFENFANGVSDYPVRENDAEIAWNNFRQLPANPMNISISLLTSTLLLFDHDQGGCVDFLIRHDHSNS